MPLPSLAAHTPASRLPRTRMAVTFDTTLVPEQNLIACATLPLAWQQLLALVGRPDAITPPSPTAEQLTRVDPTVFALDPATYLALAGFGHDQIIERIQHAVRERFQTQSPLDLPPLLPDAILAFSMLRRALPFAIALERLARPLRFADTQLVTAFGAKAASAAAQQITILDYQDAHDFVLEIANTTADQLVLAKVPPCATLQATIAQVQGRVAADTRAAVLRDAQAAGDHATLQRCAAQLDPISKEQVQIPHIHCQIQHRFHELIGISLRTPRYDTVPIANVEQMLQFELSEEGATAHSAAKVLAVLGIAEDPRSFIFDRPFLVWLQAPGASWPYLAMWIGNAELLMPAEVNT